MRLALLLTLLAWLGLTVAAYRVYRSFGRVGRLWPPVRGIRGVVKSQSRQAAGRPGAFSLIPGGKGCWATAYR